MQGIAPRMSHASETRRAAGGSQQKKDFIAYPADQGRWMQVVLHAKAESSPGADDGVVQSWRRWEGESSFTKFHESFSQPIAVPSNQNPNGFLQGYILGASNSWWAEETEWLVDRFEVSTDALVPAEDL
jgi:hypothetical protein